MKRLSIAVLGLLLAAGCSSSSSTTPTTTAGTTITRFTANLKPAEETQAVGGGEASGSGTATIDFNITRDAGGTITAATTNFQVNMTGFPATTVVNIAHIHTGGLGVSGGILVNTSLNAGEVVLTNGAGSFSRTAISMTAATAQSILDNPSGFYFNVHTAANPVGVMRGQLVKQ